MDRLCPQNGEDAGKRRSTRLRRNAPWLKSGLQIQCAAPAARGQKDLLCGCRVDAGRDLSHAEGRTCYHDLGADYFQIEMSQARARKVVKRISKLSWRRADEHGRCCCRSWHICYWHRPPTRRKIRCQTPGLAHPLKRRWMFFQLPKQSARSRQGVPDR